MLVVPICANAEWGSINKSPNAIRINLLLLIFFMIHVSFSSPSEEWQRRAFRGRSPDSRPEYSPTLRAFPSIWNSGLFIADFVAVHSCEGSGGVAPLFPLTSDAS